MGGTKRRIVDEGEAIYFSPLVSSLILVVVWCAGSAAAAGAAAPSAITVPATTVPNHAPASSSGAFS